jgi:hypothetical protein
MPSTPTRSLHSGRRGHGVCAALVVAVLAAAAWAGSAVAVSAQAPDAPAPAMAEASLALTTLQGGAEWMASAAALFGLTPRLSLGGAGNILLGTHALPGSARGTEQELRAAWGGLVIQFEVARRDDREVWIRVLAGAGNAKVDLALLGTQIASDNFGVLVSEIGGSVHLVGPLRAGAAVGYRAALGVGDLPGLAPSDLRGPSARVLLSVHRF